MTSSRRQGDVGWNCLDTVLRRSCERSIVCHLLVCRRTTCQCSSWWPEGRPVAGGWGLERQPGNYAAASGSKDRLQGVVGWVGLRAFHYESTVYRCGCTTTIGEERNGRHGLPSSSCFSGVSLAEAD